MSAPQNTEQNNQPPEYHTDLPVGEILRRTRVHYNQTLQDVGDFMRIRASQLDAIEKGDVEKLPGRVYAIGYVRTYSEYLGLDGEKMVQLFKQQSLNRTQRPELHFPVAASESKAPNFFVIFASLGVLALVLCIWMVMSNNSTQEAVSVSDIPNVPADMRVADTAPAAPVAGATVPATPTTTTPVPATPGTAAADAQPPAPNTVVTDATAPAGSVTDPAATATAGPSAGIETATAGAVAPTASTDPVPPAEQPRQIVITVKERAWVEVRDKQNKAILSRILKPGEVFIVPEENYGLRLDTGNAGGLDLTVNGQPVPALGKSGDILRGMVLDGGQLLNKVSATEPAAAPAPAPAAAPAAASQ